MLPYIIAWAALAAAAPLTTSTRSATAIRLEQPATTVAQSQTNPVPIQSTATDQPPQTASLRRSSANDPSTESAFGKAVASSSAASVEAASATNLNSQSSISTATVSKTRKPPLRTPVTLPIFTTDGRQNPIIDSLLAAQQRYNVTLLPGAVHVDATLQNFHDQLYTTIVSFGNGQQLSLQLDTGSSDIWVRGPECTSSDGSCGVAGLKFVNLTDNSLSKTGDSWSLTYGDGSNVSGNAYRGPVTLGVASTVSFGVTTSEKGMGTAYDGIFGLGFPNNNKIPNGNFVGSSGLESFAFYFSNSAQKDDQSQVTFDGLDATKFIDPIQWIPLSSTDKYWQFKPTGDFVINGVSIPMSGDAAIADTGTSFIILPIALASQINKAIGPIGSSGGLTFVDCKRYDTFPIITVNIGASSISLKPEYYIVVNGDGTCFTAFIGSDQFKFYIFGASFLRATYSVYDVKNRQIGFAQAVHPKIITTTTTTVAPTSVISTTAFISASTATASTFSGTSATVSSTVATVSQLPIPPFIEACYPLFSMTPVAPYINGSVASYQNYNVLFNGNVWVDPTPCDSNKTQKCYLNQNFAFRGTRTNGTQAVNLGHCIVWNGAKWIDQGICF